jgi:beta-mannosidase
MRHYDLAGSWQLGRDGEPPIPGHLPGSTYLDYMANGMADPFWGMNETESKKLARHSYTYSRSFELAEDFLDAPHVELVAHGLDTLCAIWVNGKMLGKTDNIHRTWRLDAKPLLAPGSNSIEIRIENPFEYMDTHQAQEKLLGGMGDGKGSPHLRKTPCHFGWDWGPALPPAGLIGFIELQSY